MNHELEQYFDRPDTPSANSPIGKMMVSVLAERSCLSFEEARQVANRQLSKAAGRQQYRTTTPSQDEKRLARFNAVLEMPRTGVLEAV